MLRRLAAGFSLSTLTLAVTLVGQVISVPILLSHWGNVVYGEWLTLTNVVRNLAVLNLGVQTYVGNLLIEHYMRQEIEAGSRVLRAALRLYVIFCGLALAGTIIIAFSPDITQSLDITAIPDHEARLIMLIQGVLVTYAIFGGLLMSLFKVIGQLPRQLAYGLVERIIVLFVPVTVAWLGGMPLLAVIGTLLFILVSVVIAIRDVLRRQPFSIGLGKVDWRSSIQLIRPSLAFFAVSLAATLLSSGMIVAISATLGAAIVPVFTTTLMMTNFIRLVINQGLIVLWPEITMAGAQESTFEQLAHWHRLTLKLMTALGVMALVLLIGLGPEILRIWTANEIAVDPGLNILLAVYLLVQIPFLVTQVFGLATNHQNDLLWISLAMTFITIVSAILLLALVGLHGAAYGLIIGQIVGTVVVMRQACRWLADTWTGLMQSWLLRSLVPISTIGVLSALLFTLVSDSLIRLVALIPMILLFVYLTYSFWFTAVERQQITHVVKRLKARLRQYRRKEISHVN